MKQEVAKHLADGATTLAVSTGASSYFGWFVFINENAPGVGVLLSAFFGFIGLFFYYITFKKSTLADQNKSHLDDLTSAFEDHKEETKQEFKKVSDGISEILGAVQNER